MHAETIHTDGCCLNNGTPYAQGGVGVFFGDGDRRNISAHLSGNLQTSNRAELTAVILAIRYGASGYDLHIKTDSEYVYLAVKNWIDVWRENGWYDRNGDKVKNQDLFQTLCREFDNHNGRVTIMHVRGHSGDYGNEQADRLAKQGARS